MTTVYLVEMHGRQPPDWDPGVFRASSRALRPFLASDADRPNVYFHPRLLEAPQMERAIVAFGRAQGGSEVSGARLVLVNADHALDHLLTWGWQEGRIFIYRFEREEGSTSPPAFADVTLIFSGILGQPVPSYSRGRPTRIAFDVMDPLAELDDPLQPAAYAGDNVPPAGYEGVPETVGGLTLADAWGRLLNITAPMVNGSTEAFHFGADGVQEVVTAYDRGSAEIRDANLSGATFDSTDPATGKFNSDIARGLAKFGSTLADRSSTTWDVKGNKLGGVYVDTPGTIIKRMLKDRRGWTDDRLDLDAFTALETACPWECGLWKRAGEDLSFRLAIDKLVASVFGYRGIRRDGKFTLGVTTLPTGDPVARLLRSDIINVEQLAPVDRNNGTPPSETVVDHARNWTVQREGLAGNVLGDPDRKAWLAQEYRSTRSPASAGVLAKFPNAKPLRLTTLLIQTAHAQALGDLVQDILEEEPALLRITAIDNARSAAVDLADAFELDYPLYGWDERPFRCLRLKPNEPRAGLITIEGWG